MHVLACKRHPVRKLMDLIPIKYLEALEQNQQIPHCCRHPENHDIEAWYSDEKYERDADGRRGAPDIYILHCTCGRKHRRFCAGGDHPGTGEKDIRPYWDVR